MKLPDYARFDEAQKSLFSKAYTDLRAQYEGGTFTSGNLKSLAKLANLIHEAHSLNAEQDERSGIPVDLRDSSRKGSDNLTGVQRFAFNREISEASGDPVRLQELIDAREEIKSGKKTFEQATKGLFK